MAEAPSTGLESSIRQRLLNLARDRGEDMQVLLARYGAERLLYRLSRSRYRDRFVLKGALLFVVWQDAPYRPTRDVDLLGFGDDSPSELARIFRDVCVEPVAGDGLLFDPESVNASEIREDQPYGGVRVRLIARLGRTRISLQVDIGFGDAVTPPAQEVDFPTLLGLPAPRVRVYPRESVVAEKLQAIVALGLANSRMKDFYDIWRLAQGFEFDGATLWQAIRATFDRRGTALPVGPPVAFTARFADDPLKRAQWTAFVGRNTLEVHPPSLPEVVAALAAFAWPPLHAAAGAGDFTVLWRACGPWREAPEYTGE